MTLEYVIYSFQDKKFYVGYDFGENCIVLADCCLEELGMGKEVNRKKLEETLRKIGFRGSLDDLVRDLNEVYGSINQNLRRSKLYKISNAITACGFFGFLIALPLAVVDYLFNGVVSNISYIVLVYSAISFPFGLSLGDTYISIQVEEKLYNVIKNYGFKVKSIEHKVVFGIESKLGISYVFLS